MCFGNITLTHLMTRLVLSEQLYRGFKIAKGEKYHK
jgi:23S rRNA (pseudouridine1915-N3)-methyltransferase